MDRHPLLEQQGPRCVKQQPVVPADHRHRPHPRRVVREPRDSAPELPRALPRPRHVEDVPLRLALRPAWPAVGRRRVEEHGRPSG
eukprot:6305058-Prymnesium_polylepis.1